MKALRIDIPMFNQIILFGDSLKVVEKKLIKDKLVDPEYDRDCPEPPHASGFVRMTGNTEQGKFIKMVVVKDQSPATLAHEISHVCIEVMRDLSEGDVFHAPEQYCYMMGYIYGECYRHMFG